MYQVIVLYLTNSYMTEHFNSFSVEVCTDENGAEIDCSEEAEESDAKASTCFDEFGDEMNC